MEKQENVNDPKGKASGAAKPAPAPKQSGNEASAGASMKGKSPTSQQTNQGSTGGNGGDKDLLQHAKNATGEIVNQVQQQAGSTFARQKDTAATDLSQVVQAVRQLGQSLTREESGPIARYAAEYGDKAADGLERLTKYIREQDPKQLLNDVQDFGRRQPALLLGGAFLLGFAGARLIKSSMNVKSHEGYGGGTPAKKPSTANVPPSGPAPSNVNAKGTTPTNVTGVRPPTSPNAL